MLSHCKLNDSFNLFTLFGVLSALQNSTAASELKYPDHKPTWWLKIKYPTRQYAHICSQWSDFKNS